MENKRILLVDDDKTIRQLFEHAFMTIDYDVKALATAEEALELLEEEQFPYMFFDLKLPGISGVQLCKRVRKNNPDSKIFAVTAYASIFELSECMEAGFDDYFTKPVDIKILMDLVPR